MSLNKTHLLVLSDLLSSFGSQSFKGFKSSLLDTDNTNKLKAYKTMQDEGLIVIYCKDHTKTGGFKYFYAVAHADRIAAEQEGLEYYRITNHLDVIKY